MQRRTIRRRGPFPRAAYGFVFATLLAGGMPANARAEEGAIADTIDVPARLPDERERALRSPYAVSLVDFADAGLHDLTDLLEQVPGFRVKRYGGLGALATPSVRGGGASQVEVFLDGVPLNSSQWGIANLGELPVHHLDYATVYRSGSSLESGRVGIGGALHLHTRAPGSPRTTFTSSAGSFDTYQNALVHARPLGPANMLASYSRTASDGDFSFRYDPGTRFYNDDDDREVLRQNNRFQEEGLLLKFEVPLPGRGSLTAQGDWYDRSGGIAGHGNLLFEAAASEGSRRLTSLLVDAPHLAGGRLRNELSAYALAHDVRYVNPLREPGLAPNPVCHETDASGGRWAGAYHWLEARQTLRVFVEGRSERFTPTEERPGAQAPATFTRERTLAYWGAEDRIAFRDDRLSFTASVQGQRSEDNFHGRVPFGRPPEALEKAHELSFTGNALGARWEFAPGLAARASRVRSARFPTLFELFGTSGEVVTNPALVPEEATTWDGGLRWARAGLTLDVGGWHAERDSIIYLVQNSQRAFVAQNLERVVSKGIECEAGWRRGRIDLGASFVTQDVRHDGTIERWDGRWLPYVSPREYGLRAAVRAGEWTLRYAVTLADAFYRDRANAPENRAASRSRHDATIRWQRWHSLALDLDLRNIGDDTSYDVYGYPMPGRSVYVTMTLDAPVLTGADTQAHEARTPASEARTQATAEVLP